MGNAGKLFLLSFASFGYPAMAASVTDCRPCKLEHKTGHWDINAMLRQIDTILPANHNPLFPQKFTVVSNYQIGRTKGFVTESGSSRFSMHAARAVSFSSRYFDPGIRRDHISTVAWDMRYDLQPDDSNDFAIEMDGGLQRRRLDYGILDGQRVSTKVLGVHAEWIRDQNWRISAGYVASTSGKRYSGLERTLALVQGGLPSERGVKFALDFSPSGFAGKSPLQFGLSAGAQRLTLSDADALGAPSRSDNRLMFNVKWAFR